MQERQSVCTLWRNEQSPSRPSKFKEPITSSVPVHLIEEIGQAEIAETIERAPENALISSGEIVLMQTASVEVKNPSNEARSRVRLLLDSGSQRSYISEDLAKKLKLKHDGVEEISVMTFGCDTSKKVKTKISHIDLKLKNGDYIPVSVNIVPVISGVIQRKPVNHLCESAVDLLKTVDLADTLTTECEETHIDLLLGNDYYLDLVLCQKLEIQKGLYLLSSKLGWILTGRTNEEAVDKNDTTMLILTYGQNITNSAVFTNTDQTLPISHELEDFWRVESIGVNDKPGLTGDEKAVSTFTETLKFSDGRYQVSWPWKDDIPDLPVNRELALGRLKSTLGRLKKNPEILKQYDSVIQDQLKKGIVEKVDKSKKSELRHYIPHHAVVTPQKTTTKLRIVYDASAKAKQENKSLNECLYRGPVMLHDLCGMLIRFRMHNIAMTADIEKAFLQVGLQESQRDVTRFFWVKDSKNPVIDKQNLEEYRFCRVPFGIISSPFLLGATIESHLNSYKVDLARKLKDDIYVDNLITGAETKAEAMELYKGAKRMLREASMNIREWITNDSEVNTLIDPEDSANPDSIKVLGYSWNTRRDEMTVNSSLSLDDNSAKETKRFVLKAVASVFDPLGLLSPAILPGKILLQSLWKQGLEWDDNLDNTTELQWTVVKENLAKIPACKIPRCVTSDICKGHSPDLLCFCDTSEKAYACCIYIHFETDSASKTELVFSKTRVAPVKELTIPKLEIMAVLIGVRCLLFVKNHLRQDIGDIYLWTDSMCVLHWIDSETEKSVFVRNRVREIKEHRNIIFKYVPTKDNPADIATRGISVERLMISELWWHGPKWLSKNKTEWPVCDIQIENSSPNVKIPVTELRMQQEVRENVIDSYLSAECEPLGINIQAFSSMTKLLRVTAYVRRFITNIQNKKNRVSGSLTSRELEDSERLWLTYIQKKHFGQVFNDILGNKSNNLQNQLQLFIDEYGILRSKGRIENSNVSFGARYPVLLPKADRFTELLVEKCHKELLHSGVSQTLSNIRYGYWIIQGRAAVRAILRKCINCKRHEGGPYKMPTMPPLPPSRVRETVPFSKTGLDYLGPLLIRTKTGIQKVWICLFTCLVTRGIHLEVVLDLTTDEFLLALRRFVSQRGKPSSIYSDNALQFKAADKCLGRILQKVTKSDDVLSYAANAGIQWTFIVEMALWMGGYYERLVGLVKRALRKTLNRKLLTCIQLQTLLKEIEAILNSRPLVYVGDDIQSSITITPGHFMSFNTDFSILDTEADDDEDEDYTPYESTGTKIMKLWKKGMKLLGIFWKLWRDEYLLSLRERTQHNLKAGRTQSQMPPSRGDIVLVKDHTPWVLGGLEK